MIKKILYLLSISFLFSCSNNVVPSFEVISVVDNAFSINYSIRASCIPNDDFCVFIYIDSLKVDEKKFYSQDFINGSFNLIDLDKNNLEPFCLNSLNNDSTTFKIIIKNTHTNITISSFTYQIASLNKKLISDFKFSINGHSTNFNWSSAKYEDRLSFIKNLIKTKSTSLCSYTSMNLNPPIYTSNDIIRFAITYPLGDYSIRLGGDDLRANSISHHIDSLDQTKSSSFVFNINNQVNGLIYCSIVDNSLKISYTFPAFYIDNFPPSLVFGHYSPPSNSDGNLGMKLLFKEMEEKEAGYSYVDRLSSRLSMYRGSVDISNGTWSSNEWGAPIIFCIKTKGDIAKFYFNNKLIKLNPDSYNYVTLILPTIVGDNIFPVKIVDYFGNTTNGQYVISAEDRPNKVVNIFNECESCPQKY